MFSGHVSSDSEAWITETERIGYNYVMPLVCLAGIILNSLVVLVLSQKTFRASTYSYLIALAVADVCTAVLTLPVGAVRSVTFVPVAVLTIFWQHHRKFCQQRAVCNSCRRCGPCIADENGYSRLFYEIYIYVPLTNTSENVSAWMTVVLALDRVLTLKTPLQQRVSLAYKRNARLTLRKISL